MVAEAEADSPYLRTFLSGAGDGECEVTSAARRSKEARLLDQLDCLDAMNERED